MSDAAQPLAAPEAPADDLLTVERIAVTLRERILSGAIPTGTWLRQERLAVEFGVSRTPVREALRALQAEGTVQAVPKRGALVVGSSVRDIREAYAVRAELEGFAAEQAAQLISDEQLDRLKKAEQGFRDAVVDSEPDEEPPAWIVANDQFHEAILEAADNRRLTDLIRALHRSFPRNVTWSALRGNSHLLQENAHQHGAILEALTAHDPVRAREAMTNHVRRAGELVARRYEALQDRHREPGR